MNDELHVLVRDRLEMARRTLDDAHLLVVGGGSPWGVVNRAYYACFYATLALLLTEGTGSAEHAGVIALFDRLFVKNGRLPRELSRLLHRLFDLRQAMEHRELVRISHERAEQAVTWAEEFVLAVEQYLTDQGVLDV